MTATNSGSKTILCLSALSPQSHLLVNVPELSSTSQNFSQNDAKDLLISQKDPDHYVPVTISTRSRCYRNCCHSTLSIERPSFDSDLLSNTTDAVSIVFMPVRDCLATSISIDRRKSLKDTNTKHIGQKIVTGTSGISIIPKPKVKYS